MVAEDGPSAAQANEGLAREFSTVPPTPPGVGAREARGVLAFFNQEGRFDDSIVAADYGPFFVAAGFGSLQSCYSR